ncbi:MBL fold metallo-hydrolase [Natrinema amylolyticum]|uniref:MBL fold metallo-hydrolase n=1 Tax=Natrinema amylolyticum TaxID=2878679 RepID=UPI001CFA9F5E|nr:MBL fold metallo-hydrolase [Natrinema amylolyticum]
MVDVTILVDNTVATPIPKGLRGEWGFAAAVDDVLFDTGQSSSVVHNARLLDVPASFETIVLSHTHFDHTGGLDQFLDPLDKPTVYCHPDLWESRYSTGPPDGGEFPDPIHLGIPFSRTEVESGAAFVEHREPVEVAEGIFALGEIPREHRTTTNGKRRVDGELVDDTVDDDQAIAVRTTNGTALVLGCCHAGLRNSIEYAEAVTGEAVRYVIGGTHLVGVDADTVHELADWLEGKLELFAGTHCTGFQAQRILADRLPEAFRSVGVGSTIELPPTV